MWLLGENKSYKLLFFLNLNQRSSAHPAAPRRGPCCSAGASEPDRRRSPRLPPPCRPAHRTPARPSPARKSERPRLAARSQRAGRGLGPAAPQTEGSPAREGEEAEGFIFFQNRNMPLKSGSILMKLQVKNISSCLSPGFVLCLVSIWLVHQTLYLVVLGAALVLVQSDALPVQDPVMPFPLGVETTNMSKVQTSLASHEGVFLTSVSVLVWCSSHPSLRTPPGLLLVWCTDWTTLIRGMLLLKHGLTEGKETKNIEE